MGLLKDALEAISATHQKETAGSCSSAHSPLMPLASVYHLFRAKGIAVLGAPETAFAVYDQKHGVVRVYVSERRQVDIVPYEVVLFEVLADVQEAGASFMVCGEDVICVLDGVMAHGTSYGDAALHALAMASLGGSEPQLSDIPGRQSEGSE